MLVFLDLPLLFPVLARSLKDRFDVFNFLSNVLLIVPPHASANLASLSQHALDIWCVDST